MRAYAAEFVQVDMDRVIRSGGIRPGGYDSKVHFYSKAAKSEPLAFLIATLRS